MQVYYRLSDHGYDKKKPTYINNENCLMNFLDSFGIYHDYAPFMTEGRGVKIHVIADLVNDDTWAWLESLNAKVGVNMTLERTGFGNGAASFSYSFDKALELEDKDEIVYFVENDYVHMYEVDAYLKDGLKISPYVTLYDHPDKYIDAFSGGNPYVEFGGELTRVFLGDISHWKLTNSTTMTFASKVWVLREDKGIIKKHTSGTHPNDFQMFLELRDKGRELISSIPGKATHGETAWMSPLNKWERVIEWQN